MIEAIANPYKEAGSSGIAVADFLVGKGVTVVVAEGFGSRIVEVMKSKGIRSVAFQRQRNGSGKKGFASQLKLENKFLRGSNMRNMLKILCILSVWIIAILVMQQLTACSF